MVGLCRVNPLIDLRRPIPETYVVGIWYGCKIFTLYNLKKFDSCISFLRLLQNGFLLKWNKSFNLWRLETHFRAYSGRWPNPWRRFSRRSLETLLSQDKASRKTLIETWYCSTNINRQNDLTRVVSKILTYFQVQYTKCTSHNRLSVF